MKTLSAYYNNHDHHHEAPVRSMDTAIATPERLNGLLISEIKEGLDGIETGNFPIRLMTKRVKSPHENGFNDWIRFIAENPAYQRLRASEKELLASIDRREELSGGWGVNRIVDVGCGDGSTLAEFVSAVRGSSEDAGMKPIDLVDTSGIAVQQAKDALAGYATKTIIADVFQDPFSPVDAVSGSSNGVVFTSFGGGWANYTPVQKQHLRDVMGVGGRLITSTFAYPQNDEQKQQILNAYSGTVAKDQIWHLLDALGFSTENLDACDFVVKRVDEIPGQQGYIASGFIPKQDIVVTSVVQKNYTHGRFYPLYTSCRNHLGYEQGERHLGKLGEFDQTLQQRTNETHIITLHRLYQGAKQERREERVENLKSALRWSTGVLLLLFGLWWGGMFDDHARLTKKQESEMEALFYTGPDYDVPLIHLQEKAVSFLHDVRSGFENMYQVADYDNPYFGETEPKSVIDDNAIESRIAPTNGFVREHRRDTLTSGQALGIFFEKNASLFVGKRYGEPKGRLSQKSIDDCTYTLDTDLRYEAGNMTDNEMNLYVDSVGRKIEEYFQNNPRYVFDELRGDYVGGATLTKNFAAGMKYDSPRGHFMAIPLGDLRPTVWSNDAQAHVRPTDSVANFLLFIPPKRPDGATTWKDLLPYSIKQAKDMLYAQRKYEITTKGFPSAY